MRTFSINLLFLYLLIQPILSLYLDKVDTVFGKYASPVEDGDPLLLTYKYANKKCESIYGQTLASIKTDISTNHENVIKSCKSLKSSTCYIGLKTLKNIQLWQWESGGILDINDDKYFGTTFKSNLKTTNELCAVINPTTEKYEAISCATKRPFVCDTGLNKKLLNIFGISFYIVMFFVYCLIQMNKNIACGIDTENEDKKKLPMSITQITTHYADISDINTIYLKYNILHTGKDIKLDNSKTTNLAYGKIGLNKLDYELVKTLEETKTLPNVSSNIKKWKDTLSDATSCGIVSACFGFIFFVGLGVMYFLGVALANNSLVYLSGIPAGLFVLLTLVFACDNSKMKLKKTGVSMKQEFANAIKSKIMILDDYISEYLDISVVDIDSNDTFILLKIRFLSDKIFPENISLFVNNLNEIKNPYDSNVTVGKSTIQISDFTHNFINVNNGFGTTTTGYASNTNYPTPNIQPTTSAGPGTTVTQPNTDTYIIEMKEDKYKDKSIKEILTEWNLSEYYDKINELGYDDILDWKDIPINELTNDIGFKIGHARKFTRLAKEYYDSKNTPINTNINTNTNPNNINNQSINHNNTNSILDQQKMQQQLIMQQQQMQQQAQLMAAQQAMNAEMLEGQKGNINRENAGKAMDLGSSALDFASNFI